MSFLHPRRWPRLLFWLCTAFALYLLLLALYTLWQIPPIKGENALQNVRENAQASVAEKRAGNTKGYKWVNLRNIKKEAYQAIIASEDGRFYQHGGIDWDAIQQAAEKNWQRKTFSVGGSTISQQTVKNVYLSNNRSLIRKYRELMGTYLLEYKLSKKEILEIYLNIIEFGPDIYGIHHAARYYFNKTPADLTAREGAFLAVLMPAPKKYFYSIYQAKRMNTRHNRKYQRILRDMRRQGNLSEGQYRAYANHTFYGAPPLDKNIIENLDGFDEQLSEESSAENTDNTINQSTSETPAAETPAAEIPASENTGEENNNLTPEQAPPAQDNPATQEETIQPENTTAAGDISA